MSKDEEHSLRKLSPSFVISAGTQVVLTEQRPLRNQDGFRKPGSVGIVAVCPAAADGDYLIEFTDGGQVHATFAQLVLRRREIETLLEGTDEDLTQFIIYRCQVGSKAFGLSHEDSDDDIRGIYLPPARLHWSLNSLPEQLEFLENGDDQVFWELEKFVRLALKANPNVLEVLWTDMVLQASPVAVRLREIRDCFLSRHLFKTYSGYVLSQFRRMENRFESTGTFKKKHAMHLIRLLHSGINAVQGQGILIDVGKHRDELLAIRDGEKSLPEIRERALQLDKRFQLAYEQTSLPEQPDFQTVNQFLIEARLAAVEKRDG